MQRIIEIPDSFYFLSLREQESIVRQALEKQRKTRQKFLEALQQVPDVETGMTEAEQLALIDRVREDVYAEKYGT